MPAWVDAKVPILGVTGAKYSGKTLFVSSIDPESTLMIDNEKSSETYQIPFKRRIDLFEEMVTAHPGGHNPIDSFRWFLREIDEIKTGQYTVIAIDPISDIESGLADWVASRYADFGFSSSKKFKDTGGIFWSYVLNQWKQLLGRLSAKCETFAFTTHLRDVWRGGTPTGVKEPKGKSTLFELASLYLFLERPLNAKDKPPSAKVLKSRLAKTVMDKGELKIIPVLPDKLPEATPKAIREYIKNPIGLKARLAARETAEESQLSEDDKLLIEQDIASKKLEAERLSNEGRVVTAELAAQRQAELKGLRQMVMDLAESLNMPSDAWDNVLKKRGAASLDDLTQGQLREIASKLKSLAEKPQNLQDGAPSVPSGPDEDAVPVFDDSQVHDALWDLKEHFKISDADWIKKLEDRGISPNGESAREATAMLPRDVAETLRQKLWSIRAAQEIQQETRKN
jgi:hypothetical protein